MRITESAGSDISTVYAYLTVPDVHPSGGPKFCDVFSCFNGTYQRGKEREFITQLNTDNPGKYSHYHIGWSSCE